MTNQLATVIAANVERAITAVKSEHTPIDKFDRAMLFLRDVGVLDDQLIAEAEAARLQRRWRQRNTLVSQKERSISDEWVKLRISGELGRGPGETLAIWIVGRAVGLVESDVLTVTLEGVVIPVMPMRDAERENWQSMSGVFTLRHKPQTNEMVISTYTQASHIR